MHLPTGEEPPKGYESLVSSNLIPKELDIDYVFVSALARIELAEINAMRTEAFTNVEALTGLTNAVVSFEDEISILPGKVASDKLLFRAYRNNELTGYALVVIGWPENGDWVIQHLVINPRYRLQGIGSSIVRKIEDFALKSEVASNNILAIPLEEKGVLFWKNLGYTDAVSRESIKIFDLDHELMVYCKPL